MSPKFIGKLTIMDFKKIQEKLAVLRDRIRSDGCISPDSEQELKNIMNDTLTSASQELTNIQTKLSSTMAIRAGNDNQTKLSDDQKKRLRLVEKTGTGSEMVH